jgi:hypothetical protein
MEAAGCAVDEAFRPLIDDLSLSEGKFFTLDLKVS